MTLRRFQVHGLSIESDFDLFLQEDSQEGSSPTPPKVTLRQARPRFFDDFRDRETQSLWKPYRCEPLPDGSIYLCWRDLFDFLVASDGRSIAVGARSEAFSEAYMGYLLNFALSFALLQMGDEVLHATVVALDDQAIGFLGASGAGKSTLAAYLLNRGFKLVTDDLLRVTFRGTSAVAYPGTQRIKLSPESAAKLINNVDSKVFTNNITMKHIIVPAVQQRMNSEVPLSALYLLKGAEEGGDLSKGAEEGGGRGNSIYLSRLRGSLSAVIMLGSTFNGALKTKERLTRQLLVTGEILSRVPVFRLSYPRRFEALSPVYEQLVRGLRQ